MENKNLNHWWKKNGETCVEKRQLQVDQLPKAK